MDKPVIEGVLKLHVGREWKDAQVTVFRDTLVCIVGTLSGQRSNSNSNSRPKIQQTLSKSTCAPPNEVPLNDETIAHQIEILPDYARRSRHSKLYPFHVKCGVCDGCISKASEIHTRSASSVCNDGCILACDTAEDMWKWAVAVRWRGSSPPPTAPPNVPTVESPTSQSPQFSNPALLQDILLSVMTIGVDISGGVSYSAWSSELNIETTLPVPTLELHNSVLHWARHCLGGAAVHGEERNFDLMISANLVDLTKTGRLFNSPLSLCCEADYSPSRARILRTLIERGSPLGERAERWGFTFMLCKPEQFGQRFSTGAICGGPVNLEDQALVWDTLIPYGDGQDSQEEFLEKIKDQAALVQAAISNDNDDEVNNNDDDDDDDDDDDNDDNASDDGGGVRAKPKTSDKTKAAKPLLFDDSDDSDFLSDDGAKKEEMEQDLTAFKYLPKQLSGRKGITELKIPPELRPWWSTLTNLDLSRNQLTTLPEWFWTSLSLMQVLDVSNNCLLHLSPDVKKMKQLKTLSVQNNCLERLPIELESIECLKDVQCLGNPIVFPPKAIWDQGWGETRRFFEDILTYDAVPNTDLKVLVVGLSEAGKTSLINGLIAEDGNAHLVHRGDRTVGIEQRKWSFGRPPPTIIGMTFAADRDNYFDLSFDKINDEVVGTLTFADARNQGYLISEDGEKSSLPDNVPLTAKAGGTIWNPKTRSLEFTIHWAPFKYHPPDNLVVAEGKPALVAEEVWYCKCTLMDNCASVRHGEFLCINKRTVEEEHQPRDYRNSVFLNNVYHTVKRRTQIRPNKHTAQGKTIWDDDTIDFKRTLPMKPDVNLNLFDFAGQQEYYITHHIFLTERALYVLAFDLSKYSKKTVNRQVFFWVNAIQDRVPSAKLLVVGTHADMISPEEAQKRCTHVKQLLSNWRRRANNHLNKKFEIVGVKLQELANQADERLVNHLKRTHKSFWFTTVEDVDAIREKAEKGFEISQTELKTVQLFETTAASDEYKATIPKPFKAMKESLKSEHVRLAHQMRTLLKIPNEVFPVSSATLVGVDHLRDEIKIAVQDKAAFRELDENLPTYYFQVRDHIRSKRQSDSFAFMDRTKYIDMMRQDLNLNADEVERATEFMHIIGEVLYYKELEVIFLKVAYLVDAFKYIIRHDHAEATVFRSIDRDEEVDMNEFQFEHDKTRLLSTGILSIQLLEQLWAPPAPFGLGLRRDDHTRDRFFAMVALLARFDVAGVVRVHQGEPELMFIPEFQATSLPPNSWSLVTPPDQIEGHRWFQFNDGEPPGSLMRRLQAKLCALPSSQLCFAKEGAIVPIGGCKVWCALSCGNNSEAPPGTHGLQVIVRGRATSTIWKTMRTMVTIIESLLAQWPGLRVEQYCVHRFNETQESSVEYLRIEPLREGRKVGMTEHSSISSEAVISLDMLLGPSNDMEEWDLSGSSEQRSMVVAHEDGELDMDSYLDSFSNQIISEYRATKKNWVMLCYAENSKFLAQQVFDKLTEQGVPAWIDMFSGSFGTAEEQLRDGFNQAGAFTPILTEAFMRNHDCVALLEKAVSEELQILPIYGEAYLKETNNVATMLRSARPSVLRGNGASASTELEDAVCDLIERCKNVKIIETLAKPLLKGETTRERRLSFGGEQEVAEATTLRVLFETILSFPDDCVAIYLEGIKTVYTGDDADELLQYEDEDLEECGIKNRVHRRKISKWKIKRAGQLDAEATTDFDLNTSQPVQKTIADGCKHDVYISYDNNNELNSAMFQHLVATITVSGRVVFKSTSAAYDEVETRRCVRESRVVLAVMSASLFESLQCRTELDEARKAGKVVVPVYDGDTILAQDVLKLKDASCDLRSHVFRKNIVQAKHLEDTAHATGRLLDTLNRYNPLGCMCIDVSISDEDTFTGETSHS